MGLSAPCILLVFVGVGLSGASRTEARSAVLSSYETELPRWQQLGKSMARSLQHYVGSSLEPTQGPLIAAEQITNEEGTLHRLSASSQEALPLKRGALQLHGRRLLDEETTSLVLALVIGIPCGIGIVVMLVWFFSHCNCTGRCCSCCWPRGWKELDESPSGVLSRPSTGTMEPMGPRSSNAEGGAVTWASLGGGAASTWRAVPLQATSSASGYQASHDASQQGPLLAPDRSEPRRESLDRDASPQSPPQQNMDGATASHAQLSGVSSEPSRPAGPEASRMFVEDPAALRQKPSGGGMFTEQSIVARRETVAKSTSGHSVGHSVQSTEGSAGAVGVGKTRQSSGGEDGGVVAAAAAQRRMSGEVSSSLRDDGSVGHRRWTAGRGFEAEVSSPALLAAARSNTLAGAMSGELSSAAGRPSPSLLSGRSSNAVPGGSVSPAPSSAVLVGRGSQAPSSAGPSPSAFAGRGSVGGAPASPGPSAFAGRSSNTLLGPVGSALPSPSVQATRRISTSGGGDPPGSSLPKHPSGNSIPRTGNASLPGGPLQQSRSAVRLGVETEPSHGRRKPSR